MNAAKSPGGSSRENEKIGFVLALTGRGKMARLFEKASPYFIEAKIPLFGRKKSF
jgi:hypothetical protein